MRESSITLLLILTGVFAFGQTLDDLANEIRSAKQGMLEAKTDTQRSELNAAVFEAYGKALHADGGFNYNFGKVPSIADLKSPDGKVRIINWNLPLNDGTNRYYGYIAAKGKKGKMHVFPLKSNGNTMKNPEFARVGSNRWYGALYYGIAMAKKRGKRYYTLIGWDGVDKLTHKKMVDAFTVSRSGEIAFGHPIFKMGKRAKYRVVFEYSAEYTMSMQIAPNGKAIIFDYLDVPSDKLKGIPEYYGPGGTQDALLLKKGKWFFTAHYEARNPKSKKDKHYNDPEKKIRKPKNKEAINEQGAR